MISYRRFSERLLLPSWCWVTVGGAAMSPNQRVDKAASTIIWNVLPSLPCIGLSRSLRFSVRCEYFTGLKL